MFTDTSYFSCNKCKSKIHYGNKISFLRERPYERLDFCHACFHKLTQWLEELPDPESTIGSYTTQIPKPRKKILGIL